MHQDNGHIVEGDVQPNAHPESELHQGDHSAVPYPPPEDHPDKERHCSFPDTGWRGSPEIPSKKGGNYDKDFINKPPYCWKSEGNNFIPKYTTECWCGNVAFEFHGDPLDAKHCHCRQCQHLHGAPFQWAVIFPKTAVRLVRNVDHSLHFFSTATKRGEHYVPCKVSCDVCRSPLFDEGRRTVLAYPISFHFKDRAIPKEFQPTAHIFYSQRVMEVPDGIPKWSGHKGESELIEELTDDPWKMPKYKGEAPPQF